MSTLSEMLRKARAAVLRRGAAADDADDLVQEAFLRLEGYERAHKVRSQGALLVSAAVNLSIDQARRQRRAPFAPAPGDLDAVPDETAGPDEILAARTRLRRLEEGIGTLPARTRRILLRRRIDGIGYRTIAEEEGMTVSAVEKQVARATLELMRWMEEW